MHKFNKLKNDPFFNEEPVNKELILYFNTPGTTNLNQFYFDVLIPDFCPFERMPSNFSFITNTPHITYINGSEHFGVVFQCPSCHKYCIIDYVKVGTRGSEVQPYDYNFFHPNLCFTNHEFKLLSSISPHFKDIYVQSAKADNLGLNMIYPMGYRKALEFLIDGYLMNVRGKSEHTITQNRLSENITATKDPDLIHTAKVAAWAGNDDTHLKTRNPELNIVTLKDSLKSFVHFVINKLISIKDAKYIKNHSNN